jgi:uncharacterized membrane protein YedE/YeeE
MLAITIFVLFAVIAVISAVTLVDCWLKAQHAYADLSREWALIEQGFGPVVEAQDLRLRQMAKRPAMARNTSLRSMALFPPAPARGACTP